MNISQGRYIHLEPILALDIPAMAKAIIDGDPMVIPAVLKDSKIPITITGQLSGLQRILKGDRNHRFVIITVDIDSVNGLKIEELGQNEKMVYLQLFHFIDKEGGQDCAHIYVCRD
ncbi:MAG: hypothetical protein WC528_01560 [Patescibacteria group bacterium]